MRKSPNDVTVAPVAAIETRGAGQPVEFEDLVLGRSRR